MHQKIFVTGATGTQGGYVARQLLKAGHTVHAIVRDSDSAAAQALRQAGVKIFPGNFDSVDNMVIAAQDCTSAFINVSPVFSDPQGEAKHGKNVVNACRKAGVRHVVLSSVPGLDRLERGELRGMDAGNPTLKYSYSKIAVERSVIEAGFESWAILQLPRLLSSFVDPLARLMFPRLAGEGIIRTAIRLDLRQSVIDPFDIGQAVALLLDEGGDSHLNKKLKLAGAQMTFPEIIEVMNEILADQRIHLEQISEIEAQELRKTNLIVGSEMFLNQNPEMVVVEDAHDFGFRMHSAKEYFGREKALLERSVGTAGLGMQGGFMVG
jgi:uncharacterized protein YbjT (DUF2867 family)